MQTFLPLPSLYETFWILDYRRLGKQRVETKQILMILEGMSSGWSNHPAVRMWKGHNSGLALYGAVCCTVWRQRGYRDTLLPWFQERVTYNTVFPPWTSDSNFHRAHQSNLIKKNSEFYGPIFPGVPDDLPYMWPVD